MKIILLTILILILVPNTDKVIGTYQIIDELSYDTLEINKDGSYVYKDRGDSCWTWYDFDGNWEIKNNQIILTDNREYEESTSDYQEIYSDTPNDLIVIKVVTTDKKAIPNFPIEFKSIDYKIESKNEVTNSDGIVKFKKHEIVYDEFDNSSILFKYFVNKNEVSENGSVSRNADTLILTLNRQPKTIKETLKHHFEIKGNELVLTKSESLFEGKRYKKL